MIIGITGTDGAGKGEKVLGALSQDRLRYFWNEMNKNIQRVYSTCKVPEPVYF